MLDLIQGYVSGDFGGGRYDAVLSYMALIVLGTLVTGMVLSLNTRRQERRVRSELTDTSPDAVQRRRDEANLVLDPPDRFSLRHLTSWHPIAVVLLSAMSAASLWLGWQMVVLPLAAATALSYLWHFHLRHSGVRWAATYSIASWIVPYLIVVATIIRYRPSALETPWPTFWEHAFVYSRLNELDPELLMAAALYTLGVLTATLVLAQFPQSLINPASIAVLACPIALCVWFAHPFWWALPLGAFTLVLFGHAMSREHRFQLEALETLEGRHHHHLASRWTDMLANIKRFDPLAVTLVLSMPAVVALHYDHFIYYWVGGELRDYDLHWVWLNVIRTALFWAPLVTLGVIGYVVMRKVVAPRQVAPYVVTAIVVAVMLHTVFDGASYLWQFTQVEFTWTGDYETFRERNIRRGIDTFVYTGPRLGYPGKAGMPLALSYVVAVAFLVLTFKQCARGDLANYGGVLCGMASFVIVFWVLDLTVNSWLNGGHIVGFWQYVPNDLLLANLTIAAIAMFALLYWGFGPGSIRTDPRQPRPRWRATANEVR